MKIKIYYRKSLKMSEGKLGAVCAHIGKELGREFSNAGWVANEDVVIVLGVSDKKFLTLWHMTNRPKHIHVDRGLTEVVAVTHCAFGYIEEEIL